MESAENQFSKELRIVLTASKSQLSGSDKALLEGMLGEGVDWPVLLRLSKEHKVFPRVWERLSRDFSAFVPEETKTQIKNDLRVHFVTCAKMLKTLFGVLDLFAAQGISILPFKGPVLAAYLYDDFFLRSYGDLDFLISHGDFPRVYHLLTEAGYKPSIDLSCGGWNQYSYVEDDLVFFAPSGVGIEIHWELSGRYLRKSMGIGLVKRNMTTVNIHGREVSFFSVEDHLIYFCLHGARHFWEHLDLVSCVAELLWKTEAVDWDYVFTTTEEYRCRRMVFVGLLLADELFGLPVPEDIAAVLRSDTRAVLLSEKIYKNVYVGAGDADVSRDRESDPRFSSWRMDIHDSRFDAFWYSLRLLFIPSQSEWQAVHFPPALTWMYFVIRPFRVLGAGVTAFFRLGRK